MLLHMDVCTHRCFYSEMLLRAATFTHRCFYTGMLLHTGAFRHMCFYTWSLSTQSILYTEKLLHKYSYAEIFLGANTFIQRRFWNTANPQILLQRGVLHGCFYTEMLLHTGAFRSRALIGRGAFALVRMGTRFTGGFNPFWIQAAIQSHLYVYTRKSSFCREMLLHTSALTQGPSHRDGLKKEIILQRDASTRRCSYTEMLSTQRCLYTQVL
jgi:hypothetical protein